MVAKKSAKEKAVAPSGDMVVLNMRLSREMLEEVDVWVDKLNDGHHGPQWSRTAIVRASLARALKERGTKGMDP